MKMTIRFVAAAVMLAASLVFASGGVSNASGCQASLCTVRSDGNLWCCNLTSETERPNACYYANFSNNCACQGCHVGVIDGG
jgi:hypothetical protein